MLAVLRGEGCVARVMLVRRRHIDDLDRRIGAEFLDAPIGFRREFGGEARPRLRPRVGGSDQFHMGVAHESRQHHRKGAAKPRNAEAQLAFRPVHCSQLDSIPEFD